MIYVPLAGDTANAVKMAANDGTIKTAINTVRILLL